MSTAFITTFESHQMPVFKDIIQTQETQVRPLDWEDPSRKWQPTPVFLLGKFHGQGGLAGYSPRDRKELDTAERASTHAHIHTLTATEDGEGLRLSHLTPVTEVHTATVEPGSR